MLSLYVAGKAPDPHAPPTLRYGHPSHCDRDRLLLKKDIKDRKIK